MRSELIHITKFVSVCVICRFEFHEWFNAESITRHIDVWSLCFYYSSDSTSVHCALRTSAATECTCASILAYFVVSSINYELQLDCGDVIDTSTWYLPRCLRPRRILSLNSNENCVAFTCFKSYVLWLIYANFLRPHTQHRRRLVGESIFMWIRFVCRTVSVRGAEGEEERLIKTRRADCVSVAKEKRKNKWKWEWDRRERRKRRHKINELELIESFDGEKTCSMRTYDIVERLETHLHWNNFSLYSSYVRFRLISISFHCLICFVVAIIMRRLSDPNQRQKQFIIQQWLDDDHWSLTDVIVELLSL